MLLLKPNLGKFDGTWHRWFAWRPVWAVEGIVWLETVDRKWTWHMPPEASCWRYRRLK